MASMSFLATILLSLIWTTSCKVEGESNKELATKIDEIVKEALRCHPSPALSVSVVKDGNVVLSRGYGHTTADKKTKATSKTQFAIGSLTKAFSSHVAIKYALESMERVTLDTPITKFIKGFRLVDDYRTEHATLKDLLSHRVTIPEAVEQVAMMGFDMPRKEFLRKVAFIKSPYSFRDEFIYSNAMYILVGAILEELSNGTSWEDQVRHSIFNPLQMSDSGFVNEIKDFSNVALPCDVIDGTLTDLAPELFSTYYIAGAAGSIYTTADDMAQWMNFLLSKNNKPIDEWAVTTAFSPAMTSWKPYDISRPTFPIAHVIREYCLGWFSGLYREYRQIMHGGSILTHNSFLGLYPDVNVGIFMATNGPVESDPNLFKSIMYRVSDLLIGLPPWFNGSDICNSPMPWEHQNRVAESPEGESGFVNDDNSVIKLDKYQGKYVHIIYGAIFISHNSSTDTLQFSYAKYGRMELEPYSETLFQGTFTGILSFVSTHGKATIKFDFDKSNNVMAVSFDLFSGGLNYVGPFYKI